MTHRHKHVIPVISHLKTVSNINARLSDTLDTVLIRKISIPRNLIHLHRRSQRLHLILIVIITDTELLNLIRSIGQRRRVHHQRVHQLIPNLNLLTVTVSTFRGDIILMRFNLRNTVRDRIRVILRTVNNLNERVLNIASCSVRGDTARDRPYQIFTQLRGKLILIRVQNITCLMILIRYRNIEPVRDIHTGSGHNLRRARRLISNELRIKVIITVKLIQNTLRVLHQSKFRVKLIHKFLTGQNNLPIHINAASILHNLLRRRNILMVNVIGSEHHLVVHNRETEIHLIVSNTISERSLSNMQRVRLRDTQILQVILLRGSGNNESLLTVRGGTFLNLHIKPTGDIRTISGSNLQFRSFNRHERNLLTVTLTEIRNIAKDKRIRNTVPGGLGNILVSILPSQHRLILIVSNLHRNLSTSHQLRFTHLQRRYLNLRNILYRGNRRNILNRRYRRYLIHRRNLRNLHLHRVVRNLRAGEVSCRDQILSNRRNITVLHISFTFNRILRVSDGSEHALRNFRVSVPRFRPLIGHQNRNHTHRVLFLHMENLLMGCSDRRLRVPANLLKIPRLPHLIATRGRSTIGGKKQSIEGNTSILHVRFNCTQTCNMVC